MSPRRAHVSRSRARLQVEQLEARELLAATVYPVGITPNDPESYLQWSLHNTGQDGPSASIVGDDIHAPAAWTITTGSMNTVVGVIDTGIDYDNPDLYGNIWINQAEIPNFWYTKSSPSSTTYDKIVYKSQIQTSIPGLITFRDLNNPVNKGLVWDNNGDGVIDAGDLLRPLSQGGWDNNGNDTKDGDTAHPDDFFGWNFVNNTNNPFDDNSHGTNVAGIIGAMGNNGYGITGIDWNVQLMAIKTIAANGFGNDAAAIAGLNYAVEHGATITNNSYAGSGFDQDMYNAINSARAAGVIYVTASGNGINYVGQNLDVNPSYPAAYDLPNIVSVTATSESDLLPSFANYGKTTVDFGAPGRLILTDVPGGKFELVSGTSMAAAEATGVLALVESLHPTWTYYQVINQVESTTDPEPALAGKTVTGGELDAYRAVSQVLTNTSGAYVVSAVPNATGAQPVSSIRLTFNEGINASSFLPSDVVSFTGPNGTIKATQIVPVYNTDNRQFDVLFPTQSTPGTYTLQLGVNIKDLSGNLLNQNRNNVNGESTDGYTTSFVIQPTYTFSNTTQYPIPDLGTAISTVTINQDISIGAIQVLININHTCDNDLYIYLQGPDGTAVVLSDRRGLYGHNYTNTLFADSATEPIANGSAPFTGTFTPEQPLSAFAGKDARGTWQLIVEDRQYLDTGTIINWSLIIKTAPTPTATATSQSVTSTSVVHTASVSEGQAFSAAQLNLAASAALRIESVGAPVQVVNAPLPAVVQQPRFEQTSLDRAFTRVQSHQAVWSDSQQEDGVPTIDELLAFFREKHQS